LPPTPQRKSQHKNLKAKEDVPMNASSARPKRAETGDTLDDTDVSLSAEFYNSEQNAVRKFTNRSHSPLEGSHSLQYEMHMTGKEAVQASGSHPSAASVAATKASH
jgi:hypothetical protein